MRTVTTLRSFTAAAASIALVALLACAPSSRSADRVAPRKAPVVVQVENGSWFDVVVYTVGTGKRWRLGMVTSGNTKTFPVPRHELMTYAGLRLLADPIGSQERFLTDRILVAPGERVALRVAAPIRQSTFAVWQ